MANARVLLTGATGFIGRRLTDTLLKMGCDVTALVLPDEVDRLPRGVREVVGDVTDGWLQAAPSPCTVGTAHPRPRGEGQSAVDRALEVARPAFVFHLAAVGTADTGLPMAEACRVNVGGMIALLEGIRRIEGVQRVVVIGTSYEYGAGRADGVLADDHALDPFNPYSASKVAAWAFARAAYNAWKLPVVAVRPFQVYGPGQRREALVPAAILAALRHEDFRMTLGEQQRDFIYVDDVVRGLLAAMQAPGIEGQVIDLGSGELQRILDVVKRIWDYAAADDRAASCGCIRAGALPYRPGEVFAIPADAERTYRLTGWRASVSLDKGLALTIEALRRTVRQQPAVVGDAVVAPSRGDDCMSSTEGGTTRPAAASRVPEEGYGSAE